MKNTSKNSIKNDLLFLPLIGKDIEIIESKNQNQIGFSGKIIFESSNLLYVENNDKTSRILKNNVVLKFDYKGKPLKVDGRLLLSTVLSRIKKFR